MTFQELARARYSVRSFKDEPIKDEEMNLTFKAGGVDGCDCAEILSLIEQGKIDTTPLITHRYKLENIEEAYHLFEKRKDGVIKVAVEP